MATDGSSQTMIATNASLASWSPDGTLIAFIKGGVFCGSAACNKPGDLWLTHPDGSGQVGIAAGATEFDWQARSR